MRLEEFVLAESDVYFRGSVMGRDQTTIYHNPSKTRIESLLGHSDLRAFIATSGDLFVWHAAKAIHLKVRQLLPDDSQYVPIWITQSRDVIARHIQKGQFKDKSAIAAIVNNGHLKRLLGNFDIYIQNKWEAPRLFDWNHWFVLTAVARYVLANILFVVREPHYDQVKEDLMNDTITKVYGTGPLVEDAIKEYGRNDLIQVMLKDFDYVANNLDDVLERVLPGEDGENVYMY